MPPGSEHRISLSAYSVFVKTRLNLRRWLGLVCLAAILLAALSLATAAVLFAFLIPIWFFFATVVNFCTRAISPSFSLSQSRHRAVACCMTFLETGRSSSGCSRR